MRSDLLSYQPDRAKQRPTEVEQQHVQETQSRGGRVAQEAFLSRSTKKQKKQEEGRRKSFQNQIGDLQDKKMGERKTFLCKKKRGLLMQKMRDGAKTKWGRGLSLTTVRAIYTRTHKIRKKCDVDQTQRDRQHTVVCPKGDTRDSSYAMCVVMLLDVVGLRAMGLPPPEDTEVRRCSREAIAFFAHQKYNLELHVRRRKGCLLAASLNTSKIMFRLESTNKTYLGNPPDCISTSTTPKNRNAWDHQSYQSTLSNSCYRT